MPYDKKTGIGYIEKCGGVPLYSEEYPFDFERLEEITDEYHARKKRLNEFLKGYGLVIFDE